MADKDETVPTTEEVQEALGKPWLPTKVTGHSLSVGVNSRREVFAKCRCGAELPNREAILEHAEEFNLTVVV